jgi:hypothetical protein
MVSRTGIPVPRATDQRVTPPTAAVRQQSFPEAGVRTHETWYRSSSA